MQIIDTDKDPADKKERSRSMPHHMYIWIHRKREIVKRRESFPVKRKYRPRGGLPYGSPPSAFPVAHYMGKREAYQVVFVKSDIDGMVLNFTGFVL